MKFEDLSDPQINAQISFGEREKSKDLVTGKLAEV